MKRSGIFCFCLLMLAAVIISETADAQPVKVSPVPKIARKKLTADLVVSNVRITPEHPRARKDMITIEVTVKNAGPGALPKVCSLAMDLGNMDTHPDYTNRIIPWYANNIPALAPGAEVKISKTITIPYPGTYKLGIIIITEGLQAGDENPVNNRHQMTFVASKPPDASDLVLDSVALNQEGRIVLRMHNSDDPIPDQDFHSSYVRVKVDNGLNKTIFLMDMDPSGILKKGSTLPSGGAFPGGGTTHLIFAWPNSGPDGIKLDPGHAYIVEVTLDYNGRIRDSNRSNNKRTVTLTYNP